MEVYLFYDWRLEDLKIWVYYLISYLLGINLCIFKVGFLEGVKLRKKMGKVVI